MREGKLPTDISIGSKKYDFGTLHRMFAETGDGIIMHGNARYGVETKFQPEAFPNDEWVDILGKDANNLDHLRISLGMTRQFIDYCRNPRDGWDSPISELAIFSDEEARILQATAVMHDWGEARSGDTPYDLKTKEKEEIEMGHLRDIFREIIGGDGDLREEEQMIAEQVVRIDNEKTTKLGLAFNMIERVGYARTGIRAYAQREKFSGEVFNGLDMLALKVVPYHVSTLIDYANTYPPVYSFLKRGAPLISPIVSDACDKNVTSNLKFSISDTRDKWFDQFLPSLTA